MKVLFYLGLTFGLAAAQKAVNACENEDYTGSDVDALLDLGEKTYCISNSHAGTESGTIIPGHDQFNLTIKGYGTTYFKTSREGSGITIGIVQGSTVGTEQKGEKVLLYPSSQEEFKERWFFGQTCYEKQTLSQMVVFVKNPTEEDVKKIQQEYGYRVDETAINSCFSDSDDSDSS
ncbi:hypothetical protein N7493_005863 [Penicillium malachiteum]|uniref:Uncharacterized protein n=1 Tax=Penicillium malachiteum TaxID=1324776 RepID=A0AAD6MVT6_9EURO|nr:hypothetical protein N7493_005863 [Penicillium malachiteum]